jgi:hypothetical protein
MAVWETPLMSGSAGGDAPSESEPESGARVAARAAAAPDVAGDGREGRADQEEHRPADALGPGVGGEQQQQEDHGSGEAAERAELSCQVGVGALLDGGGDALHGVGALVEREDLADQQPGDPESGDGNDRDDGDDGLVGAGEHGTSGDWSTGEEEPGHSSSLTSGSCAGQAGSGSWPPSTARLRGRGCAVSHPCVPTRQAAILGITA